MKDTVVFYEKPGCLSNGRQKQMLRARGHRLEVRDLLSEPWTAPRLRAFFGKRPVADWFNPSAPRLESGEVRPEALDEAQALALMISDPLLIRRPLIEIRVHAHAGPRRETEIRRGCGFEAGPFLASLGVSLTPADDVQSCSRAGAVPRCPSPGTP
jgi:nitrogenase-associated protein